MRSYPRGETIEVHRRVPAPAGTATYDDYGMIRERIVVDTISGVAVWPSTAVETDQNQERTSTTYTLALPDDARVDAQDKVKWRGKFYELRSELEFNTNPNTGTRAHTVAMVRVEG